MSARRAMIIGSAGQDGRLLESYLKNKQYALTLVARNTLDITNLSHVSALIGDTMPEEIYFLASHHHSSEADKGASEQLAAQSEAINVTAWENVLKASLAVSQCRLFYASSCLIFAPNETGLLHEESPLQPQELYSRHKLAAMKLAAEYRHGEGVHASCGILFNHESIFRPAHFLSKKLVKAAAHAEQVVVGNLQAAVDWGDAADYVAAMHAMLQQEMPGDYVVATGRAHTVREFAEIAFRHVGLNYADFVVEDPSLLKRPSLRRIGDATKLHSATGWQPHISFTHMVQRLVDFERYNPA